MSEKETIDYDHIIGDDKELKEVLKDADLANLLQSSVMAGASYCAVENETGDVLYQSGNPEMPSVCGGSQPFYSKKPLYLEGEIAGYVITEGDAGNKNALEAISRLIHESVTSILKNRYRALLATETHHAVVHQSHDELLETNRKLKQSEEKYRSLADNLDQQVRQRTDELKQAHAKLLHQEKIASVGQLAAGIAHEINNPLGFISSNMNTLEQYASKMKEMLIHYKTAHAQNDVNDRGKDILEQLWKKHRIDIILSDIDSLIAESISGANRVKKIVSDLKGFSHIDDTQKIDIDMNKEIERTLNVLVHEIPPDTEIVRKFGTLPLFSCKPADICQSFFNIILNALQTRTKGLKLIITTSFADDHIRISFTDNGPGISGEIKNRLFEPFFTTKEIGKGTGMGLNVTYEIVTSYGGIIDVESTPGHGATFIISLPVKAEILRRTDV